MKVYAMREFINENRYMPVRGYHSSLTAAKKQAKELLHRTALWDVVLYEIPNATPLELWIALLNGDSLSSVISGTTPGEQLTFIKIMFESPSLKRYYQEMKNDG